MDLETFRESIGFLIMSGAPPNLILDANCRLFSIDHADAGDKTAVDARWRR